MRNFFPILFFKGRKKGSYVDCGIIAGIVMYKSLVILLIGKRKCKKNTHTRKTSIPSVQSMQEGVLDLDVGL